MSVITGFNEEKVKESEKLMREGKIDEGVYKLVQATEFRLGQTDLEDNTKKMLEIWHQLNNETRPKKKRYHKYPKRK